MSESETPRPIGIANDIEDPGEAQNDLAGAENLRGGNRQAASGRLPGRSVFLSTRS